MFPCPCRRQQVSTLQMPPPPPHGGSPRSDSVARRQITSPPPNLWNVALESLWVITNNDPAASVAKGTIDFLSIPKPENMTLASQGWMCHHLWNEISIFGEWLRQLVIRPNLCKVENLVDYNDCTILYVVLCKFKIDQRTHKILRTNIWVNKNNFKNGQWDI